MFSGSVVKEGTLMRWIRRPRLWAFLFANALALDLLWLYQLATTPIGTGGCGPAVLPWIFIRWPIDRGERLSDLLAKFEFREAGILIVLAVVFSIGLARTLWRLGRPSLAWRLRTAMLSIAILAVEWAGGVWAWEVKDRWEDYRRLALHFAANESSYTEADPAWIAADRDDWRSWVQSGGDPADRPDPLIALQEEIHRFARLRRVYERGMWQPWRQVVLTEDLGLKRAMIVGLP